MCQRLPPSQRISTYLRKIRTGTVAHATTTKLFDIRAISWVIGELVGVGSNECSVLACLRRNVFGVKFWYWSIVWTRLPGAQGDPAAIRLIFIRALGGHDFLEDSRPTNEMPPRFVRDFEEAADHFIVAGDDFGVDYANVTAPPLMMTWGSVPFNNFDQLSRNKCVVHWYR